MSIRAATAEVARRDPVLARWIERAGPMRLRPPRSPDFFTDLLESIAYQQLAGPAAAAIWRRVAALFDGDLTPEAFLAVSDEALRGAGLSRNKAASMRDLAAKVADGTIQLGGVRRLPDDRIVEHLSVVRGIGRWTAEMFLMFTLRRLDVWPVDDYGVRKGWAIMRNTEVPTPRALDPEGDRFRPYRTVVAWYCWRAVELGPLDERSA